MTIERLSDNQFRCTLNKQDLQERHIQLNELLYGSEKAKELFRDMMQMASNECGFEAEDLPLMIEAIPVDADCLVLLVTKVEDSDELDSRFSNFTPFTGKTEEKPSKAVPALADEILNYVAQFKELLKKSAEAAQKNTPLPENPKQELVKCFSFPSLSELCRFASVIRPVYRGDIELFKNPDSGAYLLMMNMKEHSAEEFNKLCNIASEYGKSLPSSMATQLFYKEHYTPVTGDKLLETLAMLAL